MAFRKPYRAVPVRRGPRYRRLQRAERRMSAARLIGFAALFGAVAGTASVATTESGRARLAGAARTVAVGAGLMRARSPQPGDYWRGCDEARAAGTAPIYAGEPGYREGMDGDHDGIACEPYRGM